MRRRMERYRATFCLGSPPDYAAAMAGQFTLDPLTLYIDCEGTIATINGPKHKALGAQGPQAHVWNRLLFSHDEVRAVKVKGHATERDVEAGRTSNLCKRGNDLADTFAKKGADTHKPAFRVAKTVVACASLAKQAARWAAEAHVLLRFRGWNDTRAAAPRSRVRPPRTRLKRKREKETAAPAAGQVSDWLSPIFPARFSQDSHLDPRTFRGHSLQLGRVSDAGGRALDNAIIFCAKCGAVYWERADALCRQCSEFPGGRASQLRKLRSGLFPNKRYPGWTVEHVRRPTLHEAATLVAQLESCGAGLGRTVMGPTTPKKATGGPSGSGASTLGKCWRCYRQRKPSATGRSCGRRMGSTISWSQSSPSRLVVFALTGQTNLAIHVGFPLSVQHGPSETSALCVQQARQSPTTFGTLCLAALVHFHIGEVLQPLPTSEGGLRGIVMPLCLRRVMRRALRLGSSRAWLTSE